MPGGSQVSDPGDPARAFRVAKRTRTQLKQMISQHLQTMDGQLTSGASDAEHLAAIDKLQAWLVELKGMDEQILAACDEVEVDGLFQESIQFSSDALDRISAARAAMATRATRTPPPASGGGGQPQAPASSPPTVKLPFLDIEKYGGDPLKWREFWDSFKSTVHENGGLSKVEKFKYLKQYLKGEALNLAEGYPLCDDTYDQVVAVLRERFGDEELAIFAHLDSMHSLPKATNDIDDVQKILDKCEVHIRSLATLGLDEATYGRFYTPLLLSKLPPYIRVEMYRRNGSRKWTLPDLRKLLREELTARQMGKLAFGETSSSGGYPDQGGRGKSWQRSYGKSKDAGTAAGLLAATDKGKGRGKGRFDNRTPAVAPSPCIFCKGKHWTDDCGEYPDLASRLKRLSNHCRRCLREGHFVKDCQSRPRKCYHCNSEDHHKFLCPERFGSKDSGKDKGKGTPGSSLIAMGSSVLVAQTPEHPIRNRMAVMPLASALAKGKNGKVRVRILLDSGSTRCFGRIAVLNQVGARRLKQETVSLAGIDSQRRTEKKYPCYELDLVDKQGESVKILLNGLKSITCPVGKPVVDADAYPLLQQVDLAQPLSNSSEEVVLDVIIGLDYYYEIIGANQIKLDNGLVLLESRFGYVLTGYVQRDLPARGLGELTLLAISGTQKADEIREDLATLWDLEGIGLKDNPTRTEDELAQSKFEQTVQYDEASKRYFVCWPYKSECPQLPDNYGLAFGRLCSLLRRMDQATFQRYNTIIQDQYSKGTIEKAPPAPDSELVHYIPHHCVIREDRATTKIRIVYDASCKARKADRSLNECLYRGPVILADLCGLLLRFRVNKIAIISDIEKAFLQVGLQLSERDVTRFLWVRDPQKGTSSDNLIVYRFARVSFGIISSPYLLAATVKHHLQKSNSEVAKDILHNIYVDNVLTGKATVSDARDYYAEAKTLFAGASMNLREWFSNSKELIDSIPESDRGSGKTTKVLGLTWNTEDDSLRCTQLPTPSEKPTTKRQILRHLAKLYDPCGFFSPISIRGKVILQDLWRSEFDWDDEVPPDITARWESLVSDLAGVGSVSIPRFLCQSHMEGKEIHCFCDASEKAYAVAVYLRSESGGSVATSLLFAKARVSPLKDQTLTIPKLELTAIAVGCKVVTYIQRELGLDCQRVVWSDSQCAIQWIAGNATSPRYVANRVKEIKAAQVDLRYVPTSVNPADLPSRGVSLDQLKDSTLWWNGPPFLQCSKDHWPDMPKVKEPEPDVDALGVDALLVTDLEVGKPLLNPSDYSSWLKLLRVTAWVMRFVACAKRSPQKGELRMKEIEAAKLYWIKYGQRQTASALKKGLPTENSRQLGLFLDRHGVVRCSGKLDRSDLPYETRHPIYLSHKEAPRICDLIVEHVHRSIAHGGVEHTVSELRQVFWLPQCKSYVRRMVRKCHTCRKVKGGPFKPPVSPPLPDFRSRQQEAFSTVGIDYLGPLYIKVPEDSQKVWVSLFTCAATRAMHLEVVTDLTANQFLMALRRFMSLYGKPNLIVCDNAKQFHCGRKAVDKILAEICQSTDVQAATSTTGIDWKFIVELAPWMGGFYERLVGLVKNALKCSIDRRRLTLVELQTVCSEIAGILNSRPLTWVSDSVGSKPLTPKDLLTMNRPGFPAVDLSDLQDDLAGVPTATQAGLVAHWKRIQARVDDFWRKWHRDYLTSLRERGVARAPRGFSGFLPSIGAVVILSEKGLPRSQWRYGIIKELVKSADGQVRSARVGLSDGKVLHRPLKLLHPLEVPEEKPDQAETVTVPKVKGESLSKPVAQVKLPKNVQRRPAAQQAQLKWKDQLRQLDADED